MRIKFTLLCCLFLMGGLTLVQAQEVKFGDLDKSPMDAAHYPRSAAFANYLSADDPERNQKIKVLYSRPLKKERNIFGQLEPFGRDWRMGANEATEVTFYQAVEIGTTQIPAGTYTMFAQLYADQWIVKISEERFIGGSENRDVAKDLVAIAVPTMVTSKARESFVIGFQKIDEGMVHMIFEWDKTRAALPINLNPPSLAGDDASPMDLIQYPDMSRLRNYVEEKDLAANEPQVRVVYSRPQMKGRKIFGEMLKYGEMWRVGANETTELTFFKDVTINGKDVKAGRYGLFAKVNDGSWEFIIHKAVQSWGNANFDEKDVVVKMTAKTEKTPATLEALSMTFVGKGDMVELVVGWENTMARLPIKVK
ncbi:DUF2911 domain-containing protein [Neolewinella persica]|uniref:DUF2911 domain-containing protein n=1 Tax=Neolewinella persica TaxID=70998 RepID=UPI000371AFD2|nr:DUF2911 domain-containing protein [Neolewinella persica]